MGTITFLQFTISAQKAPHIAPPPPQAWPPGLTSIRSSSRHGLAGARLVRQLALQGRHPAQQVGQLFERDDLPLGFVVWNRGCAEHFLAVGNVTHDAGLRGERRLVADFQMARHAHLAGQDAVVAELGAAGDADLPGEQAMVAERHVVGDLDEVVDLGAPADGRRAERPAVHGHVRAQLDIVANHDVADLRDLAVDALVEHVAEAVRADDGAGVDADPVPDLRAGVERHVREQGHVVAEPAVGADPVVALQDGARADLRLQLDKQVRDSVAKGALPLLGCENQSGPGFFYKPSILDQVKSGMRAYEEELFGPVAVVIHARDADDALRIANDNQYGLGASIWTGDPVAGERLARRVQSGQAFVNGMVKSDPRLPFGGIKASGYGRELAAPGIREFVNIKTVWIK